MTAKPRVAVLDDEVNMGKGLIRLLGLEGIDVVVYTDPKEAIAAITADPPKVLLSDLRMPGMTGEEVLEAVKAVHPSVEVIMMTGYGTVESAMRCVRSGAFDYVTKPFEGKALIATVTQALRKAATVATPLATTSGFNLEEYLAGKSPVMERVRGLVTKFAPTDSVVLITGESGTGKELVARSLHRLSTRRAEPFVPVNCASIPETLIESELFGHEQGAFTGAVERRIGFIEAAAGGTLFLDEIGELPLALQAKLLRVLQEREIIRVGSTQSIPVNVRVLAATNRQLEQFVSEGRFREDLYYRLNVLQISLPPLRERAGDAAYLAERFLREFADRNKTPDLRWDPSVLAEINQRPWRGNIRELRNLVERAVVLAEGDTVGRDAIAGGDSLMAPPPPVSPDGEASGQFLEFQAARDRFEAAYLRKVLCACDGNVTEAAKRAGMSRRNFYDKMEKLGIAASEFKES